MSEILTARGTGSRDKKGQNVLFTCLNAAVTSTAPEGMGALVGAGWYTHNIFPHTHTYILTYIHILTYMHTGGPGGKRERAVSVLSSAVC